MKSAPSSTKAPGKALATQRSLFREYTVLETIEAGLALRGDEVKSIRAGDVSLTGSHVRIIDGQPWLLGMHVKPYAFSRRADCDPLRERRLLLHRREIEKLVGQLSAGGLTLVPIRLYLRRHRIKVELGLCRGKRQSDKRETLLRRTAEREAERAIAAHRRSRRP